jgi:hypothetical protein
MSQSNPYLNANTKIVYFKMLRIMYIKTPKSVRKPHLKQKEQPRAK